MKFILLLLLPLYAFAGPTVFMTHVQTDYDQEQKLKPGIELLLKKLEKENPQKIMLYNNKENWFGPVDDSTQIFSSQYGEHTSIFNEQIYLTGAQLGACLQYTVRDILAARDGRVIELMVDSNTVMTQEEELLTERLTKTNPEQQNELLHHYFSRMLFNDKFRFIRKSKINLYLNDKNLGSITENKLKSPYTYPSMNIRILYEAPKPSINPNSRR